MKLLSLKKILVILFSIFSLSIFCQADSLNQNEPDSLQKDSIEIIPSYRKLKLYLNYSSTNTFLGRRDTVNIPIFSPALRYTTSKNYFYQINLVHTNTTNQKFDELDLKIGKRYFGGDHYDGSISFCRYFFAPSVSRINSFVNKDLNIYNGFDFNYFYSGLNIDLTSGKKTFTYNSKIKNPDNSSVVSKKITAVQRDLSFTWLIMREFYLYEIFNKMDKLIITPEIDFIFSTQNTIHNYNKKYIPSSEAKLQTRAITFNLDFTYNIRQLTINLSPFLTIPQNSISGQETKPYFVFYGGIFYTWKWEHQPNKR